MVKENQVSGKEEEQEEYSQVKDKEENRIKGGEEEQKDDIEKEKEVWMDDKEEQ